MNDKPLDGVPDFHGMALHDSFCFEGFAVLRVPGGWIYITKSENGTGGQDMSACFVPFSSEFKELHS